MTKRLLLPSDAVRKIFRGGLNFQLSSTLTLRGGSSGGSEGQLTHS
jgi:hypothetical protein